MADRDPEVALGEDRSEGISWAELMKLDSRTPPTILTEESYRYRGSDSIPAERYISEDFARLERERMWPYVWQFAAREEDLPEAGDYVVYENAGRTYLLVRQDDGSIRAMHNVCLHRGRKLRTEDGNAGKFVCPFHGFAWNKDGSFNSMPCRWDFPHLKPGEMNLPDAESGPLGGLCLHPRREGRAKSRGISRAAARAFQALAARGMRHRAARRQGGSGQLEGGDGGLHGGLAHHRHPPPAAAPSPAIRTRPIGPGATM